jgi:SAM-dependent methyltransferase
VTDKRTWDEEADRLAAQAIASGNPTAWFDELYTAGADGEVGMPWDRTAPHPLIADWAAGVDGTGRKAIVVGCGLGADAEFLARLGYATTAFDIAPTAVRVARDRHPHSTVDYRVADLLALPESWVHGFDLVVDVFTVQALPDPPRRDAIVNVGRLVAPGGSLVIVAFRGDLAGPRPPWPLERGEVEAFATDGLDVDRIEETSDRGGGSAPRWRATFTRP